MNDVVPVSPEFEAKAAIWRDHGLGFISFVEAQRRSAMVDRAAPKNSSPATKKPWPLVACPRASREAPRKSRQYAQPMATTAARDDRLTPNAKAFLQVLRARCGKGRETTITKGTAGNIMARSTRTIRRYLVDLVRCGYVDVSISRNHRGLHLGLVVTLTEKVLPFFQEVRGLARWLAETPAAVFEPFKGVLGPKDQGVTLLSSRNQFSKNHTFEKLRKSRKRAISMV